MPTHKTAAALLGLSLLLSGIPAFADDDDASSATSSSSSSSVSSDSTDSSSSLSPAPQSPEGDVGSVSPAKACSELIGLARSKCIRDRAKEKGPSNTVRMNTAAHERNAACKDKTGLEKAICLRGRMEKKKEKFQQQVKKQQRKLDLRDAKPVRRMMKKK